MVKYNAGDLEALAVLGAAKHEKFPFSAHKHTTEKTEVNWKDAAAATRAPLLLVERI